MPWTIRVVITIAALGLAFQLYAAHRITVAASALTSWPRGRIRAITFIILLYPVLYPLSMLGSLLFGYDSIYRKSSRVLDLFFTYPFWIGIVLAVQISFFLIAIDLVRLVLSGIYRKSRPDWLKFQPVLTLALVVLTVGYCLYRVYTDTWTVRARHEAVVIHDLPPALNGFRIVQISDVHVDNRTNGRKLLAYINRANSYNADVIVFCGDLVSSGTAYIEQGAAAMGKLHAKYGVYACLGDHDFFSDPDLVTRSLEAHGITVLRDKTLIVKVGSNEISLTGVTNVYRQPASLEKLRTLELGRPDTGLDIFFTHQPANWLVPWAAGAGYDLFLAGHTHGGQVAFPMPGFILTGSSTETHYVTGVFKMGDMPVSICNGLGETLAPIRYQAPAEVTVIDVKSPNK